MLQYYIPYTPETGELGPLHSTNLQGVIHLPVNRYLVGITPDVSSSTHWAPEGVIEPRPVLNVANLPAGVLVEVDGEEVGTTSEEGPLPLEFKDPGTYRIRLSLFPYITLEYDHVVS